ncbi:MAG: hypothetical protein QOI42_1765 [Frankiaceae bacterium]|jgi:hypothetical protein|nr:hypothetical protein [Frankiaceae bacterium]
MAAHFVSRFPWCRLTATVSLVGADPGVVEDVADYARELARRWDLGDPLSELSAVLAGAAAFTDETRLLVAVSRDAVDVPLHQLAPALAVDLVSAEADENDAYGWWVQIGPAARGAGASPEPGGWRFAVSDAADSWVSVRSGGIAGAATGAATLAVASAPHAWIAMREAVAYASASAAHPLTSGVRAWLIDTASPAAALQ